MESINYVVENKDSRGFFLAGNTVENVSFSQLNDAYKFNSEYDADKVIEEINKKFRFNLESRKVKIRYELI